MSKSPEEQQRTDAQRIGEHGTGKLDETEHKDAVVKRRSDTEKDAPPSR